MKKQSNQTEKGFVILVAIGVLMGLLSIITATVEFNRANTNQGDSEVQEMSIDMTTESIKEQIQSQIKMLQPDDRSMLSRNWVLPESQNLPIRLTLSKDFDRGDDKIEVVDMRKLFFALASCRITESINSNKSSYKMKLEDDIDSNDTTFKIKVSNGGPNPGDSFELNDFFREGDYIQVGNELMVVDSHISDTVTVKNRDELYGGVRSFHKAGETVYGLLSYTGYLKVESSIFFVEITNMFHDSSNAPTFQIIEYPTGSTTTAVSVTGEQHSRDVPHEKDSVDFATVEFFPFNPGLNFLQGDTRMNFEVEVEDENGKLNLNTMSKEIADEFLNSNSNAYQETLQRDSDYHFFPMKDIKEILLLGEAASSNDDDLKGGYNHNQLDFTVFSKPNFFTNYYYNSGDEILDSDQHNHFHWTSLDTLSHNLGDYLKRTDDAGEKVYEYANNDDDEMVLPHAININTASYYLMEKWFGAMGISNPDDLAKMICQYRVGMNVDESASLKTMFDTMHYNGVLNPFDGMSEDENLDGNPNDIIGFGSPLEEFHHFLEEKGLDVADIRGLLALASRDIDAINDYKNSEIPNLVNFITFQASDVSTRKFSMNMSVDGEPALSVKDKSVVEYFNTMNDEGYHISDVTDDHHGMIVLNSTQGWNEDMSLFYGVTTMQPKISYRQQTAPIGNAMIEGISSPDEHSFTHVYPSLYGRAGASSNVYIEAVSDFNTDTELKIRDETGDLGVTYEGMLDLGMRVKGQDHPLVIAGGNLLTSPGNLQNADSGLLILGSLFKQNDATDLGHKGNGSGLVCSVTNSITGEVDSYRVTGVIDNYEGTATLIQFSVAPPLRTLNITDIVCISATTKEDFYQFNSGSLTGSASGTPAFYETVIKRPKAVYERISWDCRSSMTGGGTCMQVEVYPLDWNGTSAPLATTSATNEIDFTSITNYQDYDCFRLKFIFDNAGTGDDTDEALDEFFPSPQLFEVRIEYYYPFFNITYHDLAAPQNFIYAKD